MSESMDTIVIDREPIDLNKLLKLDNVVSGGGEAKILIASGGVRLNGQVETRKRKKVFAGDVIEYLDRVIQVVVKTSPDHESSGGALA